MYGNQWSTFKYINLIRLSLIFSLSFVYVVFFKLFIHRKHYNTLFLCYDFLTNALLRYTFIVDGFMSLVVHCSSDVTIAFSNVIQICSWWGGTYRVQKVGIINKFVGIRDFAFLNASGFWYYSGLKIFW